MTMLTMLHSSLPSPVTPSLHARPMQLNTFVVLTKKSSLRRLPRRCHSFASTSSTCSSSSSTCSDDDSDDELATPELAACEAYESYAAVAKRSSSPASRELRWSDLNRPSATSSSAFEPPSSFLSRFFGKTLRLQRPSGQTMELQALELCFEFLDLEDLQTATRVCRAFHSVVAESQMLLSGLYSRQWRCEMLPRTYVTLPYHDQLALCAFRRAEATYPLSTRSSVETTATGTSRVTNNSMLRSFARGAVDSVRGVAPLPVLSCARALQKQISYYEVRLKGCGSVGLASLSDATTRDAYGFGSREHVGWKGISYGYHGNDGDFVFNDGAKPYGGVWEPFGPSWGRVDAHLAEKEAATFTVGCGLDAEKHQVFFTLNGKLVGVASTTVLEGEYAAAVSLHAFGDTAVLNLGTEPFVYDIEGFCASPQLE